MTADARQEPSAPPVARALRPALAAIAQALPSDLGLEDIAAYRAAGAARTTTAAEVAARLGLSAHADRIAGADVTVFRAADAAARARVVFLHGGGLIAGNRFDGVDVVARHAEELGLEVWTLEYPLAPEATYPVMVDAAVAAVVEAGRDGLPVVLAGQSAGGGVAAATALACRERGVPVLGQLLVCPMLSRRETTSMRQYAADPSWSAVSNATGWAAALAGTQAVPPGERQDLAGLGATFLDAGSAELFRDAIVAFAGELWSAGVRTELHVWSGGFHGSDCAAEGAVVSAEAHRARREWLRRLLTDEL